MTSQTVGLVGLGLMGTAIARRFLQAGLDVLGFDVDAAKRSNLTALGGREAGSVREIAERCRYVALAVFTTDQVEQVVEGDGGLSGAATRTVICTSTCDPDRVSRLAARVAPLGLAFLEVPVSGTSAQVERGDGVGLVAGDDTAAKDADPVIAAICPKRFYLGAAGNGGRAKLAINLILGLNRAAIAEGVAFAERMGLDRGAFLDVAKGSAAYSQVMDVKGEFWASNRFDPPMSRVDQSLKDFKLMLEMGGRLGVGLPFAELYAELLSDCVAHGESALDNAIIINAVRRRGSAPR